MHNTVTKIAQDKDSHNQTEKISDYYKPQTLLVEFHHHHYNLLGTHLHYHLSL
jgi:hypothetical protein